MCALRSSSWSCWTHQAWHFIFFFLCLFWWEGMGTEPTSCMEQMSGSSIVSRSNQKLDTTKFEMDSAMS